ncbi:hypothetical protein P6U18_20790, partial [Pseudomonas sp. L01]|nr:hypothetical protein [Pseudomonas sp. L01]
ALGMTNLNGGTLFNAEFGIRHRAAPYRKGQVLHSVFAAAPIKNDYVVRIEEVIGEKLPVGLEYFIGVYA